MTAHFTVLLPFERKPSLNQQQGPLQAMADAVSGRPEKLHGVFAVLARALPVLLCGVAGCADLLDIPSRPRLVEASAGSPGETGLVMGARADEPREPGAQLGRGGAAPVTDESGVVPIANPGAGGTGGSPAVSQPDPKGADAGTPAPGDPPDQPPAGPCGASESLGPNGNCFLSVATLLAWADARSNCRAHAQGWDLAAIRSEATDRFLSGLATDEAWIGASDADDEGTWIWVSDGEAFWMGSGTTGAVVTGAYENWNSDEPNGGGNSDCARLVATPVGTPNPVPTWADLECFELRGSVCEGPAL
jgi:lectin-like protein